MNPLVIISFIAAYFLILAVISYFTGKSADNAAFFLSNRRAQWYLVAFGMIGSSLSGVTFISVPGWVKASQFSYMQMVIGYMLGYFVIATVLMPLYYRLNLISIYTYLEQRFGNLTYKSGAFFFLISRTIGASFRLYLAAIVLQIGVFDKMTIQIPFAVTVTISILLIWLYTYRGGIKTIIWTDTFQTIFMLAAVSITISVIIKELGLDAGSALTAIKNSEYSRIFFFDDWNDKRHFIKQFLSGAFIAIVMTGLDQDLMQKNLSCRNIRDAQKNMFSFSMVLLVVNMLFLALGALLYLFAESKGIPIPEKADYLYPVIAGGGYLGPVVGITFFLGLIAATYSSADSALTALTTSVCIDFLNIGKRDEQERTGIRMKTHILISVMIVLVILIFKAINNDSVISELFTIAGYTYGPLLGMYAFGLFTKMQVKDKYVPMVCVMSPVICFVLNSYSEEWFNGFKFGFEMLIYNGILTFLGMAIISVRFNC